MQRPHLLSSGITTQNGRQWDDSVKDRLPQRISQALSVEKHKAASLASNFISRHLKATLATAESLYELSKYGFLGLTLLESA